jgi:exopolysaccharide biosynthesis polyprenyl glycosylphosphotransferase
MVVSNGQYAAVREAVCNSVPDGVTIYVALNPLLNETDAGEPEMVEGIPVVRFHGHAMPWQYETIKRVFDFIVAFTLFLIFSPLMALVAIAVKLDSPGPVFFKQVRVGRRGECFGMYKFRSMKMNAEAMLQELMQHNEASGAIFKMQADPRITRVGKIIRKLSIDELPQLFNVLHGTMSLVGPRPPLPKELQHYEEGHFTRLDGMPGITGLWQVNRGPTPNFEEMVAYDLEYLRNWSLQRDLLIILKTVPVVITGRGAY